MFLAPWSGQPIFKPTVRRNVTLRQVHLSWVMTGIERQIIGCLRLSIGRPGRRPDGLWRVALYAFQPRFTRMHCRGPPGSTARAFPPRKDAGLLEPPRAVSGRNGNKLRTIGNFAQTFTRLALVGSAIALMNFWEDVADLSCRSNRQAGMPPR